MAYTENQLDTQFQTQLGRSPTPYEVSTYANVSPQTLAGLKSYYGSLNPNASIVDYLKSQGIDPNTRDTLAEQYGIPNIGTAEGNTALLTALKSGKKPTTPAVTPITGSVTPETAPNANDASGTITSPVDKNPSITTTDPTNDPTMNAFNGSTSSNPIGGSVSGAAASTDPNNPLSDSTIAGYQKAYTDAQSQVAQIDSQIASLKNTMQQTLQQELDAAHASGGVVDEAQITAQVYQTNSALTAQINNLTAQRAQYAQAQSAAGKMYQDALSAFKESATITQGQEKIDQTETYQDAELALKQAGLDNGQWKAEQVSEYQDGQVVGKKWVAINASTGQIQDLGGSGATDNGSGTPGSSSGATASGSTVAGVDFGASSTIGAYAADPNYASEVGQVYSAIQATGLDFQTPSDIQTYITNNAPTSNVTGNMILAAARQYGVDPALLAAVFQHESNFGTAGVATTTNNPGNVGNTGSSTKKFDTWQDGVNAAAKNLQKRVDYGDPDMNIAYQLATGNMAPSEASKRAASYTNVLNDANTISQQLYGKPFSAAASDADYKYASAPATQNTLNYLASLVGVDGKSGNLAQLVSQSNALPRTQFPALNNAQAWAKLESGDPKYAAYYATLTEVSDQVAKILQGGSSGGGTSDSKLKAAQALFSAGFNQQQITAVATDLQGLLGNRAAALVGTNPFLQNMYGGLTALQGSGGSSGGFTPRGSTDASTFVAQTFATLYPGQTEAQVQQQYASQLQPGEQLAFDNSSGAIVAVNPKTDDMSKYTPL